MIVAGGKTNWTFVFIVVILGALTGGVWFPWQMDLLDRDLSGEISSILESYIPTPTVINPDFLVQVEKCFIPVAAVYGYTLRIVSGFRTSAEQDKLYEQGRTEDGHIVSWAPVGKSIHNYGYAVDVVDRWREYNIDWKKLARIGEFCGLTQVDDPHFEYRGGLSTGEFVAGKRPIPITLPCGLMAERAEAGKPLTLADLKTCGAPKF